MHEIREKLVLQKTTIIEQSNYPGKKGMNCVLLIKSPLTIEASQVLDCEQRFYTLNETAYMDFTGRITLKRKIKFCVVRFGDPTHPGHVMLQPDMIWAFSIGLEKDNAPSMQCRLHIDGQFRHLLADLVHSVNTSEISVEIEALQSSLFVEEDAQESGEGTRVDLSGQADPQMKLGEQPEPEADADPDTGCTNCNNGIALREDGRHSNGMICARAEAEEQIGTGSLASSREVVGGTMAEAKKERRGRHGRVAEPAAVEDAAEVHEHEFEPV